MKFWPEMMRPCLRERGFGGCKVIWAFTHGNVPVIGDLFPDPWLAGEYSMFTDSVTRFFASVFSFMNLIGCQEIRICPVIVTLSLTNKFKINFFKVKFSWDLYLGLFAIQTHLVQWLILAKLFFTYQVSSFWRFLEWFFRGKG